MFFRSTSVFLNSAAVAAVVALLHCTGGGETFFVHFVHFVHSSATLPNISRD